MIYDVIIVGSGPAGLTAAIYAVRAQLSVLVLEKEYMSGGQMLNTYEVDNYPGLPGIGGFELGVKFREHAEKLGVKFINIEVRHIGEERNPFFREGAPEGDAAAGNGAAGNVGAGNGAAGDVAAGEHVWVLNTSGEEFRARAVVLAMGAKHRLLGVPGEKELAGMGVSYCATCDGAFFKERTVAVVGGGDVAAEDALFLARGCEKVYLIHRRDELRAAPLLQEQLRACKNVEFIWDSEVTEICGDEQVESIRIRNKKDGSERTLELEGVFIAVGTRPNTEIVTNLLHLDKNGYISASEDGITEKPGIFAAGDIRTKRLRQIVTAVSDGANVITSVEAYLNRTK
ncbi:MAG: FAD-dependent oxidoreductase [Clostridiales bacterium]|nr:FAD-dependent oxidoreductase [Clostridiales bacterium]